MMNDSKIVRSISDVANIFSLLGLHILRASLKRENESVAWLDGTDFTSGSARSDLLSLVCYHCPEVENLTPEDAAAFISTFPENIECWLLGIFDTDEIEKVKVSQIKEMNLFNKVGVILFPCQEPEWIYWWPENGFCKGSLLRFAKGENCWERTGFDDMLP